MTEIDDSMNESFDVKDPISKEDKNTCDECGKGFSRQTTLRNHKKNIHKSKKLFDCAECNKSFQTKQKLKCHKIRTHEVKPERKVKDFDYQYTLFHLLSFT